MENKKPVLILIGVVSGVAAFRAYEVSGLSSALVTLMIAGWVLVNLMTADGILKGLTSLLEPFQSAINFLLLGFLYASVEGRGFWLSLGTGVAASALGALVSMWLYKYWTIGD